MQRIDFITPISDYGITVVISAIMIYAMVRLINFGMEILELRFAKDKKEINKQLDKKEHDERLDLRAKIGTKIQYRINQFLESHDGHRIQVVEFSNSVMSIAYLPFRYMTCTYEACTLDRHSEGKKIDRLSTSLFTQFFDNLQDLDSCIFDMTTHDRLVGGAMYDLMKDIEEKKCVCAMMKTVKNMPIGYIAFFKDDEFTNDDIEDIKSLSSTISALLCVVENKDI